MKTSITFLLATELTLACTMACAADITVPMHLINENGLSKAIGQVTISETKFGLTFTPVLSELPNGLHGFHIHEYASCDAAEKDGIRVQGLTAGGHYDPTKTNRHGPWGQGHLGDLPALYVDASGKASQSLLAPRLKLADLPNHALMIDANGDNYSDQPLPNGGGIGIACGIIK